MSWSHVRVFVGAALLLAALGRGEAVRAGEQQPTGTPEGKRIAALIDQLGSKEFARREEASRELGRLGPRALNALRRAQKSPDAEVRRRARDLVRRLERVSELIKQLGADEYAKREAASRELARLGPPALAELRRASASADPEVRNRAQKLVRGIEQGAQGR